MEQVDTAYISMTVEGVLAPCAPDIAQSLMLDEDSRVIASSHVGAILISTAFLPICLTFEDGSPQAFETVIIRGHKASVVKRYSDLAEALKGHDETVAGTGVRPDGS
jgi:hypothetical protein